MTGSCKTGTAAAKLQAATAHRDRQAHALELRLVRVHFLRAARSAAGQLMAGKLQTIVASSLGAHASSALQVGIAKLLPMPFLHGSSP